MWSISTRFATSILGDPSLSVSLMLPEASRMYSTKRLLVPNSGKGMLVAVSVGSSVGVSTGSVATMGGSGVAVAAETMTAGAGAVGAAGWLSNSTRMAINATSTMAAPPIPIHSLELGFLGGGD
jgi:hypothetical protein